MKLSYYFFVFFLQIPFMNLAQTKGATIGERSQISYNDRVCYKKVALLIGNNNYLNTQNNLKNAKNDVIDVGNILKKYGFEVTILFDLPKNEFEKAIADYAVNLGEAEIGFFYFSGHGFENNGENYMIPSDASLTSQSIDKNCININYLFQHLEKVGNPTNVILLDACRNNLKLNTSETKIKGFTTPDPPNGSLVVYGTRIGKIASDNSLGKNGTFTESLLKFLPNKQLGIRSIIDKTSDDMSKKTNGTQVPSRFDLMSGEYLLIHKPFKVKTENKLKYKKLMEEAFDYAGRSSTDAHSPNAINALNLFKRANLLIKEDTLSAWYVAIYLSEQQLHKEAAKYYQSAIDNGANGAITYWYLAEAYHKYKDFANASEYYKIGIQKYPKHYVFFPNYIEMLIENHSLEEAILYSKKYILAFEDDIEKRTNIFDRQYSIFQEYYDDDKNDKSLTVLAETWALEILQIRFKYNPTDSEALRKMHDYFTDKFEKSKNCEYLRKANQYFEQIKQKYPNNPDIERVNEKISSVNYYYSRKCR